MKLKLYELVDIFNEIQNYEYIVYDKKDNEFIFIDLNIMLFEQYEELTNKIEENEEERYYYLPSSYEFHDGELVEEYIEGIENKNIQKELDDAFYGKCKYKRFKEILRKYKIDDNYYNFRSEYLKDKAIEWCKKNNIEYEK